MTQSDPQHAVGSASSSLGFCDTVRDRVRGPERLVEVSDYGGHLPNYLGVDSIP
jgi:hypothetical protein